MIGNRKYVLAGLAAVTAVGIAAAGAYAARDGFRGGGGHGWRQDGGQLGLLGFSGPVYNRVCRGKGAEMTDLMMVRLQHRVDVTDAQKGAFDELKSAAQSAVTKMEVACPPKATTDTKDTPRPRLTPIERLGRTQAQLEASLEAVKTVRPAAEKFYASLSDEQKAKLTKEGHGKRWWKRHRDRDGDDSKPEAMPDGGAAPDAPAPKAE